MQFIDIVPKFSKAPGGNVRIELQETGNNGEARTLLDFIMPRMIFFSAVKAAQMFIAMLQREEAEQQIASLPKSGRRRVSL